MMPELDLIDNEIIVGERFSVSFQRTLRIPDDGRTYPLPPGLGSLPVHRCGEFDHPLPMAWRGDSHFLVPMYKREALWIAFGAAWWKPNAVKITVGRVNAISGKIDDSGLRTDPQNYLVCPEQMWLDGIVSGDASVRQFVAMPMGSGYTVEEQLIDAKHLGGIEIEVFEPKPNRFPNRPPNMRVSGPMSMPAPADMGIGAGGHVRQKVYQDPYGIDVWDPNNRALIHVHLINIETYFTLTGSFPPPTPIDAATYTKYGLPWFELYDENMPYIGPSDSLAKIRSVYEKDMDAGGEAMGEQSVEIDRDQIHGISAPFQKG